MRMTRRQLYHIIKESLQIEQVQNPYGDPDQDIGDALEGEAKKAKRVKDLEGTYNYKSSDGKTTKAVIKKDGTVFFMDDNNNITGPQRGQKPQDLDPQFVEWFESNQDKKVQKDSNTNEDPPEKPKKPSGSGSVPSLNSVREIQKIIDKYEVLTKHDGKWGSKTQQAWENYVNDQPKGAKDRHGGTVRSAPSFKDGFTETYPDKDIGAIKKTFLTNAKAALKELGYSKGNAADLLDFLKKIHTTKSGVKKEKEVGAKEPTDQGKSREAAKKGNEQQKRLPVTLLTDEQAANSSYVQQFWNQMVDDQMKSATGNRRKDSQKEMEIGRKYGLKRQRNDLFFFKTSGGKTVRYNSKSKAIISESLSRGALYRRRYYGRY